MKKNKYILRFSVLILLLEILAVITLATNTAWVATVFPFVKISFLLLAIWLCGFLYLLLKKETPHKLLLKFLTLCNVIVSAILAVFFAVCLLASKYPYNGNFSLSTELFDRKNVMIVVPHQDDDINLLGGMIEQYTAQGSNVSVVFATNGDKYGQSDVRAVEAVDVLTALGVNRNNIYYLGFGDQWNSQTIGDKEFQHIYNSPDPDSVWTSLYGATETYGTESIDCYLDLPYTRNNYVYSIQSVILEVMPDTIFSVDFDSHIDHRATDLFFEEALCNILSLYPDYHPTVYKGFCYGTAWMACDDFFSNNNLLSSKKPDEAVWSASAFGYTWEDRYRFPMSQENLNFILRNNSVYDSLDRYTSQDAWRQAERILNGDKVFWKRRTDSILYDAKIFVGDEETTLLNDFKLKDSRTIAGDSIENSGIVQLHDKSVSIVLHNTSTVNSVYLYDNSDPNANILEGYILFSDGSKVEFGALKSDGSATKLSFPKKQISSMEIVITKCSNKLSGLSEIEAFYDQTSTEASTESYLMAVDSKDNLVYDHMLHHTDTATFAIRRFPAGIPLEEEDITLSFSASDHGAAYSWESGILTVICTKGNHCTITVSDSTTSTTFSVINPGNLEYAYLQVLRTAEKNIMNIKLLYNTIIDFLLSYIEAYL